MIKLEDLKRGTQVRLIDTDYLTFDSKVGDIRTVSKVDGSVIHWVPDSAITLPTGNTSNFYYVAPYLELVAKWHPHHDKIIEWLENPNVIVQVKSICSGIITTTHPQWSPNFEYRLVYPEVKTEAQLKMERITADIDKLNAELKELKENM